MVVGDPAHYPFSPYMASLVVSEIPDDLDYLRERTFARTVFHTLRPYGGVAVAWGSLSDRKRTEQIVRNEAFADAHVQEVGDFVLLTRPGSLPGQTSHSKPMPTTGTSFRVKSRFVWPAGVWSCLKMICCRPQTSIRVASYGKSSRHYPRSPRLCRIRARLSAMQNTGNGALHRALLRQRR